MFEENSKETTAVRKELLSQLETKKLEAATDVLEALQRMIETAI
jgi:hypothetical protein